MAQTIENVIELWRTRALVELPGDREATVTAWVSDLNEFVMAHGFTEDHLNFALDDNPRTWAENEYDGTHQMEMRRFISSALPNAAPDMVLSKMHQSPSCIAPASASSCFCG
jgi:hypothetical protein